MRKYLIYPFKITKISVMSRKNVMRKDPAVFVAIICYSIFEVFSLTVVILCCKLLLRSRVLVWSDVSGLMQLAENIRESDKSVQWEITGLNEAVSPLCFSSACFNLVIKCCRECALWRESDAAAHKRQIRAVSRDTNVTFGLILLICLKRLGRADRQAAVNGVLRPGEGGLSFRLRFMVFSEYVLLSAEDVNRNKTLKVVCYSKRRA